MHSYARAHPYATRGPEPLVRRAVRVRGPRRNLQHPAVRFEDVGPWRSRCACSVPLLCATSDPERHRVLRERSYAVFGARRPVSAPALCRAVLRRPAGGEPNGRHRRLGRCAWASFPGDGRHGGACGQLDGPRDRRVSAAVHGRVVELHVRSVQLVRARRHRRGHMVRRTAVRPRRVLRGLVS